MQHILTEEEYKELVAAAKGTQLKSTILALCRQVATYKPVIYWGNEKAAPWGCILNNGSKRCCDECPVQDVCPHDEKRWSK